MAESYIENLNQSDDEVTVLDVPSCCFELSSAVITTNTISIPIDPTSSLAYIPWFPDPPAMVQAIILETKWETRLTAFELQTGTDYKVYAKESTPTER